MMTATATDKQESLFSYGHLRGHYLHSDMGSGLLHIDQFVRPEHVEALRAQLLAERDIFTTSPNTALQPQLSPLGRQCLWELQSGIMLRVLENITGLHHLLPDTHCRASTLLLPPATHAGLSEWRDAPTGLHAALVVVIALVDGSAVLCTRADTLASVAIGEGALQVAYWQHGTTRTGAPA